MLASKDAIQDMIDWLLSDAIERDGMLDFVRNYVARVQSYGIPVDRLFIGCYVLHPQATAWNFMYEKGREEGDEFREISIEKEQFKRFQETFDPDEPLVKMEHERVPFVRHRKSDSYFPPGTLRELFTEKGITDLYGLPGFFKNVFRFGITWSTKDSNGFSDEHIRFFDKTMPAFKVVHHLYSQKIVSHTLLCLYLGRDVGLRVHTGAIERGDGVTVKSVIWFSDIRGFTAMSSRLERDSVISLINDVFELTNNCITRNGGEILKFMGDGVLAIFADPVQHSRSDDVSMWDSARSAARMVNEEGDSVDSGHTICSKAKQAAAELQDSLAAWSRKREEDGLQSASVGVGLHYGDCSYGNVGATSRLDFTVIGPHVNLASRVEGLCSKLGASVLATKEFTELDRSMEDWNCRGEHSVKGVPHPVSIFELASTATKTSEV